MVPQLEHQHHRGQEEQQTAAEGAARSQDSSSVDLQDLQEQAAVLSASLAKTVQPQVC